MKQIKLRELNKKKYCIDCGRIVEIEMIELDGFCPICRTQLYTIDCRENKLKNE